MALFMLFLTMIIAEAIRPNFEISVSLIVTTIIFATGLSYLDLLKTIKYLG